MHRNNKIANTCNTKFLGLTLDNTLSCKTHIDTIIPKLSSSFAIRTVKTLLSQDSLRMVYYSYFYSIMTYGIIFWGNTYCSNTIFKLQKRTIWIIVRLRSGDSCMKHFKNLKILPLQSQYILSRFTLNGLSHFRMYHICMFNSINVYCMKYEVNRLFNNHHVLLQCVWLTVYSMGLRL